MNTEPITSAPTGRVHQGYNIKRFREIVGVKQETLAEKLGLNQQGISRLEQKQDIDDETLAKVAEALNVPVEALRNMPNEGGVCINIGSVNNQDTATSSIYNENGNNESGYYHCSFNPIDKLVEVYERYIKVLEENQKR